MLNNNSNNNSNNVLDDTLRVRLTSSLKSNLIEESARKMVDLSELVRQKLTVLDCFDCHTTNLPYYMVKDHVWKSAFQDQNQVSNVLCFNCLQDRLGRELVIDDFDLSLPINYGIELGYNIGLLERRIIQTLTNYLEKSKDV